MWKEEDVVRKLSGLDLDDVVDLFSVVTFNALIGGRVGHPLLRELLTDEAT